MNSEQQTALEAIVQRSFTPEEVAELDPHVAARRDGAIAQILSVGRTEIYNRMTSARGIAELYPYGPAAAEMVLMKLEGAAATMKNSAVPQEQVFGSLLARQLGFLASEGLDFGSTALRAMLDSFVPAILTTQEVAGLKSIAVRAAPVSVPEVSAALNSVGA